MKPIGNNIIFRKENTYASQKSTLIQTVEPEVAWMVQYVGPKVENIKVGDRIVITKQPRTVDSSKNLFMMSEDDVAAVYTK